MIGLLTIVSTCVGGACEAYPIVEERLGKLVLEGKKVKKTIQMISYQFGSINIDFWEAAGPEVFAKDGVFGMCG